MTRSLMMLILLALTTAFLESPLAAFTLRRWDGFLYVLGISALVNLLTNLLLNGVFLPLLQAAQPGGIWGGWFDLLLGELVLAYAGEGFLYRALIRGITLGRSMLVSAAGNTVSLGTGLVLWALFGGSEKNLTVGFAILCGIAGICWFVCLARGIAHEKS